MLTVIHCTCYIPVEQQNSCQKYACSCYDGYEYCAKDPLFLLLILCEFEESGLHSVSQQDIKKSDISIELGNNAIFVRIEVPDIERDK